MKLWVPLFLIAVLAAAEPALAQPAEPAPFPPADESAQPAESAPAEPELTMPETPSAPPGAEESTTPEEPAAPPDEMTEPEPPTTPEEPEETTEPKSEEPEAIATPEESEPVAEEEGLFHEHEPLWPDYYGPPYSPAYDPGVMLKGGCCACASILPPHTWVQLDVLLWWTRGDHLPALATTSPIGTPISSAGNLAAPGTQVLFGDQVVGDTIRAGGRLNLGVWLDPEEHIGVGGSLLGVQRSTTHFSISSSGNPILARPFFNVSTGAQDAEIIAYPNFASGTIKDRESSNFIAAEAYFREGLRRGPRGRLDLLYGYRFAGLDESLTMDDRTIALSQGLLIPTGTQLAGHDSFLTRNQFNGPMAGLWYQSRIRHWGLDIMGKIALGDIHQIAYIQGSTTVTAPSSTPVTTAGSLLALPTNIGKFHRDRFGVLPELQFNLTRFIGEHWRFRIGYTIMYLNNVLTAGRQVDTAVNPTQIGGTPLVGAARPQFQFQTSNFFIQGINLGMEFNY